MSHKIPISEAVIAMRLANRRASAKRYRDRHREAWRAKIRRAGIRNRAQRNQYVAEHREMSRAIQKKYKLAHPEVALAHKAVQYAIKIGKLVRPKSCPACGSDVRVQAHHHKGYAREFRLDVIWLCGRCHKTEHRLELLNQAA